LDSVHRSVTPPLYSYSYQASIPLSDFHSFDLLIPGTKSSSRRMNHNLLLRAVLLKKFLDFSFSLIGEKISIYTDGSKSEDR